MDADKLIFFLDMLYYCKQGAREKEILRAWYGSALRHTWPPQSTPIATIAGSGFVLVSGQLLSGSCPSMSDQVSWSVLGAPVVPKNDPWDSNGTTMSRVVPQRGNVR